MTTTTMMRSLLIAALLVSASARADGTIQVGNERGAPVAKFRIGDSHCVLKDDQIRCTPVNR